MSVEVMTWVWKHSRSKGSDRLVLLAIADCANDAGTNAYPRVAHLAGKTQLADSTVRECIGRLSRLGEVEVSHNVGRRSDYRVTMVAPDDVTFRAVYPAPSPESGMRRNPAGTRRTTPPDPGGLTPPNPGAPPRRIPADTPPGSGGPTEPSLNRQPRSSTAAPVGAPADDALFVADDLPRSKRRTPAQSETTRAADEILRPWWAEQEHPPPKFIPVRNVVAAMLGARWTPEQITRALRQCASQNEPVNSYSLDRALRRPSAGPGAQVRTARVSYGDESRAGPTRITDGAGWRQEGA